MSTTSSAIPSATSSSPSASSSAPANNGSQSTSSPLLFFVALGFGVVFTNLWIIVGVKYCFRYNQRNRQLRATGENGEPIDLANMHGPRRRRREKKLMTMEEVNERFPLKKYKLWRSEREQEGLPTAGGVTAPPSRAASIHSKHTAEESLAAARTSQDGAVREDQTAAGANEADDTTNKSHPPQSKPVPVPKNEQADTEKVVPQTQAVPSNQKQVEFYQRDSITDAGGEVAEEEDEEEDPISTAVAPEMLSVPGDSCAICIDTLEDDDDVRGLTCGHAFHAGCVDPWLTSRRACCPLCKADYYVPKPRADGTEDPNAASVRADAPAQPPPTWIYTRTGMSFRTMQLLTRPSPTAEERAQRASARRSARQQQTSETQTESRNNWRSRLPAVHLPRFGRASQQQDAATTGGPSSTQPFPTPGELEAGRNTAAT